MAEAPNGEAFLAAYEEAGFSEGSSNFGPYAYDASMIVLNLLRTALTDKPAVDSAVRAAVVTGIGQATTAEVADLERTLNPSTAGAFDNDAVTGAIGFDAYGDTTSRVLTVYSVVEAGTWEPLVTRVLTD